MEYPTSRLYFLGIHTSLKPSLYTKKIQVTSNMLLKTSNGILRFMSFDWLIGNGI